MSRKISAGTLAILMALGLSVTIGAARATASTFLICQGSQHAVFRPPVTNTPQKITITFRDRFTTCSRDGASRTFSTAVYTITTVERVAGSTVVTSVGTVTTGFDTGATAVRQITELETNLAACSTTGVATLDGPETLTFF
jgi:hypothetical protein